MDINELKQLCKQWQKRLRLQDWDIEVIIARDRNMVLPDVQAEVAWEIRNKCATIKILDPIDYPAGTYYGQDMEESLVHELLHLHFPFSDRFDGDSPETIAIEQAIVAISGAFMTKKELEEERHGKKFVSRRKKMDSRKRCKNVSRG